MKTAVIKLADGKDYILSSLTIGDLIEVEKKFGTTEVNIAKIESIVFWLWLSLKRNHKEMTIENLYDLIDAPFMADGGLDKIFTIMSELNGWDKIPKNVQSPVQGLN